MSELTGAELDLDEVRGFAEIAHKGQYRKYTNEPYINHPVAVAELVASVTNNRHMIAAALLHDVVEDTDVTIKEIYDMFGGVVTIMVEDLTDVSRPEDGNRAARKAIDLAHTANAISDSKTIKLADLIHNTSSILAHDPEFAKIYMAEKKALLRVLVSGHPALFNKAAEIVANYYIVASKEKT